MKKLILSIGIIVLLSAAAFAQQHPKGDSLSSWLEKIYAEQEASRLKSYYANRPTADTCEAWRSCAKWAFDEYVKDQSFKIVKAELRTMRRIHRHHVTKETHLFVEAVYANHTVYVEFTTPYLGRRTQTYRYIAKFPKK